LLLGDKVGDNRQVERVAEALGWPFEVRRLRWRPRWRDGKPPFLASLLHVDLRASDPLTPPWPDLVLTIGRRPAMAAMWLRRRSGGRTRIVLFGRPKRFFDRFSLLVAPVQFQLPEHARVLRLTLPLIRLDATRIAQEAAHWRDRLADLPRPLTVLLVGGRTRPYRLDGAVARDLLAQTLAGMPEGGGLYVSTSRRTPAAVVQALRGALPAGARLHAFGEDGSDNPYLALLGLGDRFVVTGDSVSMLTEIAALGRPLQLFPLPLGADRLQQWQDRLERWPVTARLVDALEASGLVGWRRDLGALHAVMRARGWASLLGEAPASRNRAPEDELHRVVKRLHGLFPDDAPGSGRALD
jgi:mitochondrial fission protein ELM1